MRVAQHVEAAWARSWHQFLPLKRAVIQSKARSLRLKDLFPYAVGLRAAHIKKAEFLDPQPSKGLETKVYPLPD
jgi:hypothetical protein